MPTSTITLDLVRQLLRTPPAKAFDYRDSKCPGLVLRARPTGIHTWRVRTTDHRWQTIGRAEDISLVDAREAAQATRARATLGQLLPERKPKSTETLGDFLETIYLPWMAATYRGRIRQVERIRAAFHGLLRLRLSEITTGHVERWRTSRQLLRRSPRKGAKAPTAATINRDLAALRSAFQRAIEWGHATTNPLARYKRGKEDASAIVRFLSTEEELRLRTALANRDNVRREARAQANLWRRQRGYKQLRPLGLYTDHLTPLILVALNTGLRRGELLGLQWRDVNLEKAFLTVEGGGAKTGQTRHIPLNTDVRRILQDWRPRDAAASDFVFPGANAEMPMRDVKKGWGALLRRANVTGFRFHDLRHTFASKLVMAGVDLNTVRDLLGHSTISMTLRYAHLAPEHQAAAVERLVAQAG